MTLRYAGARDSSARRVRPSADRGTEICSSSRCVSTCRELPSRSNNRKYGSNRILDAAIGIHRQSGVAGPDVPDGDEQAELASTRFRGDGVHRAFANQCEFELAHRSFQPQQETVVGVTRVVDAIAVDHARAHKSTELEQVMPVPAVASETRRLEAEHRTDNTFADLSDQAPKPGPIH